ncbi:hypothetical protein L1987_28009 [Smallanthus sonchifolius]|uniref:Uncharacterized protein n=1 Tax=Smallanthus sonchifolius TaxID=185202 RepID=A0ACB9IDF7_9ASTR|nr:hypothetical protein L1987_28009 [Smallanthus sonchifolius]
MLSILMSQRRNQVFPANDLAKDCLELERNRLEWVRPRCGEDGHMSRECTKPRMGETGKGKGPEKKEERPRAKSRAYTLTQEQARVDPDVASSFVSATFCKRVKYSVSKLERAFSVETAKGRTARVTEVVDNSMIKIEGHRFPVRLFVMVLGGFDVVLGMDWLNANEASYADER